jgi:hypothetical protein
MCACLVMVIERAENPQKIGLVERDHVIQTLVPNRPDQALEVRALPGCAVRDDELFEAQVIDAPAEVLFVRTVMIAHQETRRIVKGNASTTC